MSIAKSVDEWKYLLMSIQRISGLPNPHIIFSFCLPRDRGDKEFSKLETSLFMIVNLQSLDSLKIIWYQKPSPLRISRSILQADKFSNLLVGSVRYFLSYQGFDLAPRLIYSLEEYQPLGGVVFITHMDLIRYLINFGVPICCVISSK